MAKVQPERCDLEPDKNRIIWISYSGAILVRTLTALSLSCAILTGSVSFATAGAKLTATPGGAMVNSGIGYRAVNGPVDLKPGDRLMVQKDAEARLEYRDGCTVPVSPGRVITIAEKSPCSVKADFGVRGSLAPVIMTGAGLGFSVFIMSRGIHDTKNSFVSP